MMLSIALMFACTRSAPEVAPVSPTEVVSPEARAPQGSIQGEPILPKVVVVGGIENRIVSEVVAFQRSKIERCYEAEKEASPGLAGKVLVKFSIGQAGEVRSPTVRSTSLRNPTAEACILSVVSGIAFPPLQEGRVAIVQYPFEFPRGASK